MGYKVNYKGVSESGEPLPEGTYSVRIKKIQETVTKEKQRPMIKIQYQVMGGAYQGRVIFDNIVIFNGDEPGAGMTKHFR